MRAWRGWRRVNGGREAGFAGCCLLAAGSTGALTGRRPTARTPPQGNPADHGYGRPELMGVGVLTVVVIRGGLAVIVGGNGRRADVFGLEAPGQGQAE